MARPVDVTDADIIAAGTRLSERLPPGQQLIPTALWKECGSRGRADRLFAVWKTHQASQDAADAALACVLPVGVAQALAALTTSLDQFAHAACRQVTQVHDQRFAAEREQMLFVRQQQAGELAECCEALAQSAEEVRQLQERVAELGRQVAKADVLRGAAVEEREREANRLCAAQLRIERLEALNAAATQDLGDTEAVRRSLQERLGAALAGLEQERRETTSLKEALGQAQGRVEYQQNRLSQFEDEVARERKDRTDAQAMLMEMMRTRLNRRTQTTRFVKPGTLPSRPPQAGKRATERAADDGTVLAINGASRLTPS